MGCHMLVQSIFWQSANIRQCSKCINIHRSIAAARSVRLAAVHRRSRGLAIASR